MNLNDDLTKKKPMLAEVLRAAIKLCGMTQEDFSSMTGFDTSKTSRLVHGKISADPETIDAILGAFQDKQIKYDIVKAYLNDVTPPGAKKIFAINPKSGAAAKLDTSGLTSNGISALAYLLERAAEGHDVENIFVEFAKAIGWKGLQKKA